MGIVCVALGSATSLFYVMKIKEVHLSKIATEREESYQKAIGRVNIPDQSKASGKTVAKTACDWLKEAQFYIFGVVYMFARISLNTTATMMPLYLKEVTQF
jgi:hypothetical protein